MSTIIHPKLVASLMTTAAIFATSVLPISASAASHGTAHTAAKTAALPQHWELDLSHTRIGFEVEHLGFSTTMGRFTEAEGNVHYDIKNPNATNLRFTVYTDSIDTGWKQRDEHLRGEKFFNTDKYPAMSFVSTKVNFINPQQAKVTGDFTMLGTTKPLTLDVTIKKIAESPMTKEPVIGFRATGTIDRSAYGMSAYVPAITNEVPIQIDGELTYIKMH